MFGAWGQGTRSRAQAKRRSGTREKEEECHPRRASVLISPTCTPARYERTAAATRDRACTLGLRDGWFAGMGGAGGADADAVDPRGAGRRTTSGTSAYPSMSSGSSPLSSPSWGRPCTESLSRSLPLVLVLPIERRGEGACGREGSGMAIIIPRRRGTSTACACCGSEFVTCWWISWWAEAEARELGRDGEDVGGRAGVGSWRIPSLGTGIEVTALPPSTLKGFSLDDGGCGCGRGRRWREKSERGPR